MAFGLNYNIEGAKDLVEATLHSKPPTIKKRDKKDIEFVEYIMDDK